MDSPSREMGDSLGRIFGIVFIFIFQVILFIINCIYFIFIDDKSTPIQSCKFISTSIKMLFYIITEYLLFITLDTTKNGYGIFLNIRIAFIIVSIIILFFYN